MAESDGTGRGGAADAGAWIVCTTDGGVTWKEDHVDTNPGASIVAIAALSATEFWAVGSRFGAVGSLFVSFWHTTDTAQDWTQINDPNLQFTLQSGFDVECTPEGVYSPGNCWMLALDILTQESSVGRLYNTTR